MEQQRLLFDEPLFSTPNPTAPRSPAASDAGLLPHRGTDSSELLSPAPLPRERDIPSGSVSVEFVRHPRARRYLIRVRVDGSVRVTIPRRGSKREAEAFYAQQRAWVTSQQQRVAQLRERLPQDLPDSEQRSLQARARKELPARLLELAAQVGLSVRKVSVRNQRHRWGSCSASGLICLNWRLITMPGWVRDYVLYHELMHLRRMDHSPAFWAFVEEACPNYRAARRWLRRHALAPHSPEAHAEANHSNGADDSTDADELDC